MKKKERIEELKVQEKVFKLLDKEFDRGWHDWVKDIQTEVRFTLYIANQQHN